MDLAATFAAAGCDGSLCAVRLSDGRTYGYKAEQPKVMASLVKVPIALELYAQVSDGRVEPARPVELHPRKRTPGPVGISRFQHSATASLADLAYLMLTISDNAATDAVTAAIGIDAVNRRLEDAGCLDTVVVGTLAETLDGFAADIGFDDYSELLAAQSGEMGEEARSRATDAVVIERSRALDASQASRTTANDMTQFLARVWNDTAAPPVACATLRSVMAEQVTRRLGPAVQAGGAIAAKSGGLFRRVRNEMAVISDRDGSQYAVAVLTHTDAAANQADIERAMVGVVAAALDELRST